MPLAHPPTRALLERFTRLGEEADSELAMALAISHLISGGDAARCPGIDELVRRCGEASAHRLSARLRDAGFHPQLTNQPGLVHSDLHEVARTAIGIPITLSLIGLVVGRAFGCEARGVNYPGYFLVEVDGELLDPATFDVIPDEHQPSSPLPYASARDIGLRMLNNVKQIYARDGAIDTCLQLVDCQLAMVHGQRHMQAALYFEQGEYWQSIAGFDGARRAYLQCAELADDEELRGKALQRLEALQGRNQTLH
ncbi:MAG: transglutaminase family protein [Pseudomonadota bacterium]